MAFVVIYDACVLNPAPLRDLLIRLARTGLVRAQWTEMISDVPTEKLESYGIEVTPRRVPCTSWR